MSNNKFKVLIIEDEANICSFIQTLLETNGYQALSLYAVFCYPYMGKPAHGTF